MIEKIMVFVLKSISNHKWTLAFKYIKIKASRTNIVFRNIFTWNWRGICMLCCWFLLFSALWLKEENMDSELSAYFGWITSVESTLACACDRLMLVAERKAGQRCLTELWENTKKDFWLQLWFNNFQYYSLTVI